MRTDMTHTKGPWQVDSGMVQAIAKDSRGLNIPIAYMDRTAGNGTMPVERDANAHLIAAAPDMLATLQHIRAWLISPDVEPKTIAIIRASVIDAIAKAEGRE